MNAKVTDSMPSSAISGTWLAVFGRAGAGDSVSVRAGAGIASAIGTSVFSGVSATMGSLLNSSMVAGSVSTAGIDFVRHLGELHRARLRVDELLAKVSPG